MSSKLLLFLFISFGQICLSQNDIGIINPKLGVVSVNKLFFTSRDIGYGVGPFGKFCKTVNGGKNWELIDTKSFGSTYENFVSVFFVNDSVGYVTLVDGKLFKTIDGGNNLTEIFQFTVSPFDYPFLHFFSESKGIIKFNNPPNNQIYFTIDGGANWQQKPNPVPGKSFFILNDSTFFGHDESEIYKSTDGGETWSAISSVPYDIISIQFINSTTGFVVGFEYNSEGHRYYLSKTLDGGISWETYIINGNKVEPHHSQITKVYFINNTKGFGLDYNYSSVYETEDGGKTWKEAIYSSASIPEMRILDVYFIDDQKGFMVSDFGLFLITQDGGETWTVNYETITFSNLNSLSQINPDKIIIVGDQGFCLMKDTDGWTEVSVQTEEDLSSVSFSSDFVGVITGGNGSIFLTEDSGSHWNRIKSSTDQLNDVIFRDSIGLICGKDGAIYRSNNGGMSWTDISYRKTNLNVSYYLVSCEIVGKDTLLVLGSAITYPYMPAAPDSYYHCILLKSVDNGLTWKELILYKQHWLPIEPFQIKRFPSGNLIITIEDNILKSFDNGETWTTKSSDYDITLLTITDTSHIYGISRNGSLVESLDEGETWISNLSFYPAVLFSGRISDFVITENSTYIIGNKGLILGNSDAIPAATEESVFKTYINTSSGTTIPDLVENQDVFIYPNPTNGLLNIESELSLKSFSIYSSMGQLIACVQRRGNIIDVSCLPSGFYILKLLYYNGQYSQLKFIVNR